MRFLKSILLLMVLAAVAKCSTNGQEKGISAKVAELSKTESGLMTYFLEQLYVMKSKVQQLEKGENEMKTALKSCERRIQVVETRKETRCESGTVTKYGYRPASQWPHSRRINFKSLFNETPSITYGLYLLDSSYGANLRVHAELSGLSRTGFRLTLKSWADSALYGAYVSWMACGK